MPIDMPKNLEDHAKGKSQDPTVESGIADTEAIQNTTEEINNEGNKELLGSEAPYNGDMMEFKNDELESKQKAVLANIESTMIDALIDKYDGDPNIDVEDDVAKIEEYINEQITQGNIDAGTKEYKELKKKLDMVATENVQRRINNYEKSL